MTDETIYKVYLDGGCKPNPGNAGWGFYLTDGADHSAKHYGAAGANSTNNIAELMALKKALIYLTDKEKCGDHPIEFWFDSKYVLDIFSTIDKYAKNDFKKRDGQPLKNLDLWNDVYTLQTLVAGRFTCSWVKGHQSDKDQPQVVGNRIADSLASRGIVCQVNGITDDQVLLELDDKSVSKEVKNLPGLHPMLSGSDLGFLTNTASVYKGMPFYSSMTFPVAKSNKGGKKKPTEKEKAAERIKLVGKPSADTHYGVLYTPAEIPLFETVKETFNKMVPGFISPTFLFLNKIKNKPHWPELNLNYQSYVLADGNLLLAPNTEVLAAIPDQARRSYFAMDDIEISHMLRDWVLGPCPEDIAIIDITSWFLTTDDKGKQKIVDEFPVGLPSMTLRDIEYKTSLYSGKTDVILTSGIDMPHRGTYSGLLKNKDADPIVVKLVMWEMSKRSFRCAVTVQCGDEMGVYYTTYASLRMMTGK